MPVARHIVSRDVWLNGTSGRLDRPMFMRRNLALAELAMSPVIPRLEAGETAVVDAGSRFVARGGSWQPTPAQEREILRAALDETPCKRL